MITKLRRTMILMVMGVVTVLLTSIFLFLYHSAAAGFETRSMGALQDALQQEMGRGGAEEDAWAPEPAIFENPEKSDGEPQDQNPQRKADPPQAGSRAGREERPILVLKCREDGSLQILKNTLYTSETPDTEGLVNQVEKSGKESGKLSEEHLRFLKDHTAPDGSVRYAFSDTYSEEASLQLQITASLLIGTAAFLVFLVFAVWFSGWAVRPVAEAWKRQRQFAADASHELKTPLTVILSNADMVAASETLTDPENKRRLGYIRAEAGRMKQLVEELLFLARSDAGQLPDTKTRFDLSFQLESCALIFEPVAFEQGKQIETDIEPELMLEGDEKKLRQLAEILLDNACKYSDPESTIKVSLKQTADKKIRLVVCSRGTPLGKEERKQIFERFYRADPSRGKVGGYGLGLAIAQEIVRQHGGKIWAESDGVRENRFLAEWMQA